MGALGMRGCNADVVPAPQTPAGGHKSRPYGGLGIVRVVSTPAGGHKSRPYRVPSWMCGVVTTAQQQDKPSQGIGHRGGVGWLVPRSSRISRRGDWASWRRGVVSTAPQRDKPSQGFGHRGRGALTWARRGG